MALDVNDVADLIRLLRENPELRDAARRELIDEDLRALPLIVRRLSEAQERTETKVEELAEAQRRTEASLAGLAAKVEELAEAQRRTEAKVEELAAGQSELTDTTRAVVNTQEEFRARFARIEGHLSNLEGWRYEVGFRGQGRISRHITRPVPVNISEIPAVETALAEGRISEREWDGLNDADGLFVGRSKDREGRQVYAALEISIVIDENDVRRAADRAEILRKCGLEALAFVGGRQTTRSASELAEARGIIIIADRIWDAEPAAGA